MTNPPRVFLAWDPDSRTVPFTPSLGFHRLGLSAELSPPVVRDSVRMSRPGLVREHSWDCLPLTFLWTWEVGGRAWQPWAPALWGGSCAFPPEIRVLGKAEPRGGPGGRCAGATGRMWLWACESPTLLLFFLPTIMGCPWECRGGWASVLVKLLHELFPHALASV